MGWSLRKLEPKESQEAGTKGSLRKLEVKVDRDKDIHRNNFVGNNIDGGETHRF